MVVAGIVCTFPVRNDADRGLQREGCIAVPQPLSVVLITIDAFRGDLVSPKITPNLDHFSQYTTFFSRAYSPATFTLHSMAALFQGALMSDLVPGNAFKQPYIALLL